MHLPTILDRLPDQEPALHERSVGHLAVFGSMARGEDRAERGVDLGEVSSFRPEVRAAFERDKRLIF